MKFANQFCKVGIFTGVTISAVLAQDHALFDGQRNAWHLQYQDPETSQWIRKTYIPQNAISPTVQSTLNSTHALLVYRYRVTNRQDAKQLIDALRIWGIPLIYKIPNLPPVTAGVTDTDKWTAQYWAQLNIKRRFEKNTITAPRGWSAALRVDERAGQTSFVWTPGLKDTDPEGIKPGQSQEGFAVYRPELPGLARAKLTGSTEEPWGLDNLPDTPFWREKIREIQDRDYVLVPVMAPIIPIPDPYNAAELARHLRAHVQTWLKYGHISKDVLLHLNQQFDALIPALENGNRRAANSAIEALIKACRHHHPSLSDLHIHMDDDHHDAQSMPGHPSSPQRFRSLGIDRLAARALAFNLQYIRMNLQRS